MSRKRVKKSTTRKKHQASQTPESRLSRVKAVIFSLAMIIVPIVLLVMLELGLRIFNYGDNVELLLKRKVDGQTYCYVNKKVARRYFAYQDYGVPDAKLSVFPEKKAANAYRIFCLGGSTTAGFPYQFNATFPSLIKDRLDQLFPDKEIEVINMGISAINSYSVLDFTRELVDYDPDLFLIYMGHNEFYGALGVGSTHQIGQNRAWVLFYMRLQRLKTFQMMHDVISWIRGTVSQNASLPEMDRTLMQEVAENQQIELGSAEYDIAKNYFQKNLMDIVRIVKEHDADVILSTLVSNVSDQEPFSHYFSKHTTEFQREEWDTFYQQGLQLEASGKFDAAIQMYQNAAVIDRTPPILHYRRGKCLQAIGQLEAAESEYKLAKDKDAIRFRASEEFNEIIQQVAYAEQVPVIDMESVYEPYCKDNILGRTLFTDHLHPNFPGYFWMAKAFVDQMSQNACIVTPEKWPWERNKTTNEFRDIAAVTDLEHEIANQRIRRLTSRWPYKKEVILRENSGRDYDRLVATAAQDFSMMKLGWNEAHYKVADYLLRNRELDRALMEYKAVIKVTPYNYYPYIQVGDLYMRKNDLNEAEKVFNKALEYSPHLPYAYAKLGMLYYFMHRQDKSIQKLEQAIQINTRNNRFTNDELAVAYYILSMAYGEIGNIATAKEMIEKSLALNPDDAKARSVRETLEKVKM